MEFVRIEHSIPIEEYNETRVDRIVNMYSGQLADTIFDDDTVTLVIFAPSTWRTIMMNKVLLPYRYM